MKSGNGGGVLPDVVRLRAILGGDICLFMGAWVLALTFVLLVGLRYFFHFGRL